jgi:hypothetical protein
MKFPITGPLVLAIGLTLLPSLANALGAEGHRVVAMLAESQLTPKALVEVHRLLALEPGATLASVSTWADQHRSRRTAPWHYVNFPRDSCTYDKERDCPGGQCVVEAINTQTKILASNGSDESKLLALKYVDHFVADIHQPLHAGYADDRGGNTYQLQAFGRGTNLHALWDSGLIKQMGMGADTMTKKLTSHSIPPDAANLSAANAAEESCRIVGRIGFYPGRKLGGNYLETYDPVLNRQLQLAGARLAGILNRIWQ